ncbi:unnamed protein product [Mucor hiemalis]
MSAIEVKVEVLDDDEIPLSMKRITEMSDIMNEETVKVLGEHVQTNLKILDQLKHNRQVYTDMFEKFSNSTISISNMLEKVSRRVILGRSLSSSPFKNDGNIPFDSQSI